MKSIKDEIWDRVGKGKMDQALPSWPAISLRERHLVTGLYWRTYSASRTIGIQTGRVLADALEELE